MPYKLGFKVDATEAIATLRGLARRVSNKVLRTAVTKANRVQTKAVKAAAKKVKKRTGLLAKSIKGKVKTYQTAATGGGAVVGLAGASKGVREVIGTRVRGRKKGSPIYAVPTNYLHLVELGFTDRAGKKVPGYGFMRHATEASRAATEETLNREIMDGIRKELAKANEGA